MSGSFGVLDQSLDNDELCIDYNAVNTTYMDHPKSHLFSGIMFTIKAKRTLRISTFALDARFDEIFGGAVDYGVQVYTLSRAYVQNDIEDASAWTRIASTESLPTPIGGIVIPSQSMKPQTVQANQQHSFYIHVNGRYIDSRANGLDKTGERDQTFDDFEVYVGSGLNGKFKADDTVDPKFSGIVFYEKDTSCVMETPVAATTKTTIQYEFRIDDNGKNPSATESLVNRAVDDFLDLLVSIHDPLVDASQNHGLVKVSNATSTSVVKDQKDCSQYFMDCFAVTTEIKYEHADTIFQDDIEFEFYQYAEDMARRVQEALATKLSYNGRRGITGKFQITLKGVPSRQQMNDDQKAYFESATLDFLRKRVSPINEEVYSVNVQDQLLLEARTLEVTGRVRGSQFGADGGNFGKVIQETLRNGVQDYLRSLYFKLVVPPSPLMDEDVTFYRDITESDIKVEYLPATPLDLPTLAPTPVPDGLIIDDKGTVDKAVGGLKGKAKDGGTDFWLPVGIIVGMALVAAFILWILCKMRNNWKMRYKYRPSRERRECAPPERRRRKKAPMASQAEGRNTMDLGERSTPVQSRTQPKKSPSTQSHASSARDLFQSVSSANFRRQKHRRQRSLSGDSDAANSTRPSAPRRDVSERSQQSRFRPPARNVSGMSDFDVRSVTSDTCSRADNGENQTQYSQSAQSQFLGQPESELEPPRRSPSPLSPPPRPLSPPRRFLSPPRGAHTMSSPTRVHSQRSRRNYVLPQAAPNHFGTSPSPPRSYHSRSGSFAIDAPTPSRQHSPGRRSQSMHHRQIPPSPKPSHAHSMHQRRVPLPSPGPTRKHHSMHHQQVPPSLMSSQNNSMHHRGISPPGQNRSKHQRHIPPPTERPMSHGGHRSRSVSPRKSKELQNIPPAQWSQAADLHQLKYNMPDNLKSHSRSAHDRPMLSGFSRPQVSYTTSEESFATEQFYQARVTPTNSQRFRSSSPSRREIRSGSAHSSPQRPSRQPSLGGPPPGIF